MANADPNHQPPDWYAVLQVAPDASDEVIHGAYRALVKQHHPDRYRGASSTQHAEERMKAINQAYNVLGDATKRACYDRERQWASDGTFTPATGSSHPINRIVKRLFGNVPWWLWLMLWIVVFPRLLRVLMITTLGQILLGLATVFVFWRLMPKVPVQRQ